MGLASSAMGVHPWILYAAILLLVGYVAVDLMGNHGAGNMTACGPIMEAGLVRKERATQQGPGAICQTLEGHMDIAGGVNAPNSSTTDPWKQVKWLGAAARCRVKGHLIEQLDPENNFRRGFALRYTDDVEDKTHVLPWLLGVRENLNAPKRRVYIDLGANAMSTSITWFSRMYPCDFTEIHAFEVDASLLRKPAAPQVFREAGNQESPNQWARSVRSTPGLPQWLLDRISLYHQFVSDFDDPDARAVNITRFFKDTLRLRSEDTVVVKMDIEGSEWPILRRWMSDPDMAALIDELFVEVHYDHPSMRGYHWARFAPTSRLDATRLLADLRFHGFFVHAWP